jgi:hypothetical protein
MKDVPITQGGLLLINLLAVALPVPGPYSLWWQKILKRLLKLNPIFVTAKMEKDLAYE